METPASAVPLPHAHARVLSDAAARIWERFRPHRDITTTLAISGAMHLAVLLIFGAALYASGEDSTEVPELSVQIETRAGPSSQEMTDAALPQPAPEPVEQVLDNPGTADKTLDAPAVADEVPQVEDAPTADVAAPAAAATSVPDMGNVITTTAESPEQVVAVPEAPPQPEVLAMPQPEQQMLAENVQKLAQKLLDTNMTNTELTWTQEGKQYSARVLRQPAPDSTGLEQVIAEVMTDSNGKRMKTRLSLKRLAFSHFTQLVNSWDPNIRLHDDVIDGRFHSNTEISIAFDGGIEPRFFGKVTTSAASMLFDPSMRRKNKQVFQGGIETRTERVSLPRDMPDVMNGGDPTDRVVFTADARILFNSDGTFVWRATNGSGPLERVERSDRPRYLIADKGVKLSVSGTISGIVTVYAPGDIEIENDLVYAHDPRDSVMSRDFLALIAGRDIKVAPAQITGAGDLHVDAAMFARRKFAIELSDRGKPGTLYIFGSLTAGTIFETEPRYATKMDFDKRFEYLRPASFPMTRRYEVDSWDQGWEEVDHADAPGAQGLARSE